MENLLELAGDPNAWIALATLTVMEVVLGIDNLIFISVLTNKLPEHMRSRARRIGIGGALVLRLGLLGIIAFIVQLTAPLFTVMGEDFSWRDIILIFGGLFLIWKATSEIHHMVDPHANAEPGVIDTVPATMMAAITQILLLDLVFSLDSIITAVGMTPHVPIMVVAVVIAVICMLIAADPLARFVQENPTVLMLALAFLLLIGTTLIADGFGSPLAKGYVYSAMAFSAVVEFLNVMARKARQKAAESAASDSS